MKWQSIIDMTPEQFNKLSKQELKGYTQILASVANKRLKRAQEQGFDSPSIDAVLVKGKFSTKDKNINQLRNEFMRAKRFLTSKTGTLSEFKKFRKETINALKEKEGIEITEEQFDIFWRTYEQLKKERPEVANKGLKYNILKNIDYYQKQGLSMDNIIKKMKENLEETYQEGQAMTKQAEENASELQMFFASLPEAEPVKQETANHESRSASKAARAKARRKRK